ncbi:hypothetical protein TanjilG_05254 [Lupinus angustifolius]|uniref:KANL2-like probable zinc-finger domain-containing protein n=1 Tax=Lupinus angustifolius TaxID=3871 RepID=A0A4P1RAW6_LUPAN|nr:PREDICTED: INO80 complex subunit D-like [Lupinus angustifolius]OIW06483.1 hypothetical protein TanjilG_05254 [Lupinus angustifolius]
MDISAANSTQPHPTAVDGADHDSALAKSRFLTREELIRRRLRRVRQLGRFYRDHYWTLMEDIRSKYRDYCWNFGKSPFICNNNENGNGNGNDVVLDGVGDDIVRCRFSGCKSKAMALTTFCHAHILSDPKQNLYMGCRTVAKNLPTGPSFCNKPVLKSMVPPACPTHYDLGTRCLVRALRKSGLGNTFPTNHKTNVKLHVLTSEFVRQIQNKRKIAMRETVPKAEIE